ncbi:FHA domain-containing protein [Planctomycetota bacterium]
MAKLLIDMDGAKLEFEIDRDKIVIGRDKTCDLTITGKGISRQHCEIENISGTFKIKDLKSANGIRVNKNQIDETYLRDQDEISIGVRRITFILDKTDDKEKAYLECLSGLFKDKKFSLGRGKLVIGRADDVDLHITDDSKISSRHAEIVCDKGTYFISDLGSSNGTKINGKKAGFRPLVHGDKIEIGSQEFQFNAAKDSTAETQYGLVWDGGDKDGQTEIVKGPVFSIGRSMGNDLRVDVRGISGIHCSLVRQAGQWVLRDNRSKHGTFLNGQKIIEREINHGDKIKLGKTEFYFNDVEKILAESQMETAIGKPSRVIVRKDGTGRFAVTAAYWMVVEALVLLVVLSAGYHWFRSYWGKEDDSGFQIATDNLLSKNPSFEEGLDANGMPKNWLLRKWDPANVRLHSSKSAVHGTKALAFQVSSKMRLTEMVFQNDIAAEVGEEYELEFSVSALEYYGVLSAQVEWVGSQKEPDLRRQFKVSPEWQTEVLPIKCPEGVKQFRVAFLMLGRARNDNGTLLLDHIYLHKSPGAQPQAYNRQESIPGSGLSVFADDQGRYTLKSLRGPIVPVIGCLWDDIQSPVNVFDFSVANRLRPEEQLGYEFTGEIWPGNLRQPLSWRTRMLTYPQRSEIVLEYKCLGTGDNLRPLYIAMDGLTSSMVGKLMVSVGGDDPVNLRSLGGNRISNVTEITLAAGTADQCVLKFDVRVSVEVTFAGGGNRLKLKPAWRSAQDWMQCNISITTESEAVAQGVSEFKNKIETLIQDGKSAEAYQKMDLYINSGGSDSAVKYCQKRMRELELQANHIADSLLGAARKSVDGGDLKAMEKAQKDIARFTREWQGVPFKGSLLTILNQLEAEINKRFEKQNEKNAKRIFLKAKKYHQQKQYTLTAIFLGNILLKYPRASVSVEAAVLLERVQAELAEIQEMADWVQGELRMARMAISNERKDTAKKILEGILKRYPSGPHVDEVKELLAQVRSGKGD